MARGADLNVKADEGADDDEKRPYRELIGALMYLVVATRSDIAHAVSALSQYNESNTEVHWNAAKRVLRLRYIKVY